MQLIQLSLEGLLLQLSGGLALTAIGGWLVEGLPSLVTKYSAMAVDCPVLWLIQLSEGLHLTALNYFRRLVGCAVLSSIVLRSVSPYLHNIRPVIYTHSSSHLPCERMCRVFAFTTWIPLHLA